MKWLRSPRLYPVLVVTTASIAVFAIIHSGDPISMTFPLLIFISAKLSVLFACVEIGLSVAGLYKEKELVYQSISRAITALGMAFCFLLLLGAFETAN
jgi:hypothetical protein